MIQLWDSSLSIATRPIKPEEPTGPLQGYGIRWKTLTRAEQLVCASIALLPLWWILGWSWTLAVWMLGIIAHDIFRYGNLRFKSPTLSAAALLAFGFYTLINSNLRSPTFNLNSVIGPTTLWICAGLALWYIQSNDIRIRPQVMAWAFSVSIIQMIVFWLIVHFGLSEHSYIPYRTLFGFLTDKGEQFIPGAGNANYLKPYEPSEKGLGGLARYSFFFAHPSTCALWVGFAALLSLDMKNRIWATYMVLGCSFLLLLGQTRSAWLAFPVALAARYFFNRSKVFLFALVSVVSLAVLSLPPITDSLLGNYTGAIEATSHLRKDSSKVRNLIYARTLERIPEELLLGHGINGPTVLPGFDAGRIGSHSFFLGTLLYKAGVLGTAIFTTFLVSLFLWLARTKTGRPTCCFFIFLYFGLNLLVEEPEIVTVLLVLLCTLLRETAITLKGGLDHA